MYKGKLIISEDQGDVAILFCDICDFDKIVIEENKRLVLFLDSIFRAFDQFCFNFKAQKIETVGKTYMACAGLKEYEYSNLIDQKSSKNSTTRILELAIEMIKHAQNYKWGQPSKELKLKIGIHFGPVLAGVIGFHKPQFSLIGDTVNTTSRVCSTGESGKIIMSEEAYNQVVVQKFQENLEFIPKIVQAKGKGKMVTYQVEIKGSSNDQTFFSKMFSQSSPKHSFFHSPASQDKVNDKSICNYGFGDAVITNEDINLKEKSNGFCNKVLKSSDEITHVSNANPIILRKPQEGDWVKEESDDLSLFKKMINEDSSKNYQTDYNSTNQPLKEDQQIASQYEPSNYEKEGTTQKAHTSTVRRYTVKTKETKIQIFKSKSLKLPFELKAIKKENIQSKHEISSEKEISSFDKLPMQILQNVCSFLKRKNNNFRGKTENHIILNKEAQINLTNDSTPPHQKYLENENDSVEVENFHCQTEKPKKNNEKIIFPEKSVGLNSVKVHINDTEKNETEKLIIPSFGQLMLSRGKTENLKK